MRWANKFDCIANCLVLVVSQLKNIYSISCTQDSGRSAHFIPNVRVNRSNLHLNILLIESAHSQLLSLLRARMFSLHECSHRILARVTTICVGVLTFVHMKWIELIRLIKIIIKMCLWFTFSHSMSNFSTMANRHFMAIIIEAKKECFEYWILNVFLNRQTQNHENWIIWAKV